MTPRSAQGAEVVVVGLGGLGSATAWQLARRGVDVVGLEQFELGHVRGASHDTSRILRRSYHTPRYVRFADEAYVDWAALSAAAGTDLVTVVGGVDIFPSDAAIPSVDYADSMRECGVPFDVLTADDLAGRWPALSVPPGTTALFQADTAIVPAGRTTRTLQRLAIESGAHLRGSTKVTGLAERPDGTVEVVAGGTTYVADRVGAHD